MAKKVKRKAVTKKKVGTKGKKKVSAKKIKKLIKGGAGGVITYNPFGSVFRGDQGTYFSPVSDPPTFFRITGYPGNAAYFRSPGAGPSYRAPGSGANRARAGK